MNPDHHHAAGKPGHLDASCFFSEPAAPSNLFFDGVVCVAADVSLSALRSERGYRLVVTDEATLDARKVDTFLTVEASGKWYALYLVVRMAGNTGWCIFSFPMHALEKVFRGHPPYRDHCPNPDAVDAFEENTGIHVDEVAFDAIVGRWYTER